MTLPVSQPRDFSHDLEGEFLDYKRSTRKPDEELPSPPPTFQVGSLDIKDFSLPVFLLFFCFFIVAWVIGLYSPPIGLAMTLILFVIYAALQMS